MNDPLSANKSISHARLWLLSVVVGSVAGFGAVAFRAMIGPVHNLMFLGHVSTAYNANLHTPASPWGAGAIFIPVAGACVVVFLVQRFAPEARGHGVPEVMDAIYYHKGVIRPVVAVIKALASALSIGTGGSVGREGPIVQIGSSFGSTVGQWLHLPAWQRITIIAAGAGGGIAATFNTPIGGVLFAAELLLHEVSVWTLVPVVISTATATYIGRLFLGANPSFVIPAFETPYFHPTNPLVLLAYVGLGFFIGGIAAFFIRLIYWVEDFFEQRVPGGYYARHILGMLLIGLAMFLFQRTTGHYYVQGVGYATVQDVFAGVLHSFGLLLLLFAAKALATSITLGSGGSGGIFSPSLFLGATFGGAYGVALKHVFPALPISPPAFAVVGMAGVVGGVTGAAITAIVMIFEMTLDYNVVLPMTITVAISYGVRKFLSKESIYTLKLVRRGHYMPESLQANFHLVRLARELMQPDVVRVPASASLRAVSRTLQPTERGTYLLVEDEGKILGVVKADPALRLLTAQADGTLVGTIARVDYDVVTESTTVFELLCRLQSRPVGLFLVAGKPGIASARDIKGVVSKERLADALSASVGMFTQ